MKKWIICLILVVKVFGAVAGEYEGLAADLKRARNDSQRITALRNLGKYFLLKTGEEKADMDSSRFYLDRARGLSVKIGDKQQEYQSLYYVAILYAEMGEWKKSEQLSFRLIAYFHQNRDPYQEALSWESLGNLYKNGGVEIQTDKILRCYAIAATGFMKSGDIDRYLKQLIIQGDILVSAERLPEGEAKFQQVIRYLKVNGAKVNDGDVWYVLAINLSYLPGDYYNYNAFCYRQAYGLYLKKKQYEQAVKALEHASKALIQKQRYAEAAKGLQVAIDLCQRIKSPYSYKIYYTCAELNNELHDYKKSLEFYTKAAEHVPADDDDGGWYYYRLGTFYLDWKMPEKGVPWIKKAIAFAAAHKDKRRYISYLVNLAKTLLSEKKAEEALAMLTKDSENLKDLDEYTSLALSEALASTYLELKDYRKARAEVIKIPDQVWAAYKNKEPNTRNGGMRAFYTVIVRFYLAVEEYQEADVYLKQIEALPKNILQGRPKLYYYRFQIDSARGDYLSAIASLQRYKSEDEALNSVEKTQEVNELSIKYDVAEKDKSIAVLRNNELEQQAKIRSTSTQRNITLGGIFGLFLVSAILLLAFIQKRRGNRRLRASQIEITRQNTLLEKLLGDKEALIQDKDWLLKEVHHRVKNNLQIIMSLLNSQSAFLESEEAVGAIRESQNRVRSIALIHQRLYSGNNLSQIDMKVYIADLISFLSDSFDTAKSGVVFQQSVAQIHMDVSQAVPLGLILNECITNAIKYAFGKNGGQISVSLQLCDSTVLLTVADNGRGLPRNFSIKTADSLGMKMMKALNKQLGGEFSIASSAGGTELRVAFALKDGQHAPLVSPEGSSDGGF